MVERPVDLGTLAQLVWIDCNPLLALIGVFQGQTQGGGVYYKGRVYDGDASSNFRLAFSLVPVWYD
jgi:hypothetical protein